MSRALFVSDIHISSSQDQKCALFLRVLDLCVERDINDVFLVGDIFDLWISDREFFTTQYHLVIAKIQHLKTRGIRVHYFEGNHDLDLRRFWQHKLGVDVYSEAAFFTLNGLRFRVEHGDLMDRNDRGYLFLRWLLRTPLMVFLQRHLPNWAVRRIGQRASQTSRGYTSQIKVLGDEDVRKTMRNHALQVYGQVPFDVLVAGHVHVVEDAMLESAGHKVRCMNLGTWLKQPMLIEADAHGVTLKTVDSFLAL